MWTVQILGLMLSEVRSKVSVFCHYVPTDDMQMLGYYRLVSSLKFLRWSWRNGGGGGLVMPIRPDPWSLIFLTGIRSLLHFILD